MALYALRLRRALTVSSSILHLPSISRTTTSSPHSLISQAAEKPLLNPFQPSRFFTSTNVSLSSRSRSSASNYNDSDEIGPDTILFEGCDYNHWLIVIDFPKDSELSPEEKVKFYEETAAKIFGSLEEAKKKIYACSTTTYQGFQVECSEETSEKFKDLPGVIFVLPDSYIDPVNKEYGGDKYINGQIIPRPPPIQYGRNGPRRDYRSRPSPRGPMEGGNRDYGPPPPPQQNYGQPPPPRQNFGQPPPPQQNFGQPPPPQQNYGQSPPPNQNYGQPPPPQQNYGVPPPQQSYGRPHPPQQQYNPRQQDYGPPRQQSYGPPPQQNHGPPPQQNYGPPPQQNYGTPTPPQQNYGTPPPPNYGPPRGDHRGHMPYVPGGWDNPQGGRRDPIPSSQTPFNQGERGDFYPHGQSDLRQGNPGSFAGPPSRGGNFGQAPPAAQGQESGPAYNSQNYQRN